MDFSKLFKIEKSKISEELEQVSLKGKEDKEIRKIVLENFPKLFPHLELFNEGNQYAIPVFKKIKKPDTLAFCESEKRMWIFEYKSKIDEDLIEQVRKYRDGLQNSNDNLYELILSWNEQAGKHRKLEDFKENKAKIVCIAPEFDDYAIGVEEEWKEEIYLIKITKYKDKKGNLFILLQSRDFEILDFSTSNKNGIRKILKPLWVDKFKEWISQEIEVWAADNYLTKKGRKGGGGWDFRKFNQEEVIFSICYRSQFNYFSKPMIFLVNPSEFFIKKWKLQGPNQQGSHFFNIETETNDGMLRAKQLITEFIKEKS